MPYRKFNLTVGKLSPILDDWYETVLRKLIDNFAGFAASGVNRQPKYFRLLPVRHPVCQIVRMNEHVPHLPKSSIVNPELEIEERVMAAGCRYPRKSHWAAALT